MTKLLGILNLTPDSFSDGGQADVPEQALERLERLIDAGADGVDIGAESTRPGATPLSPEQEWARLEPVLARAVARCQEAGVLVSLDTRHAESAARALALGVDWINDVSGFRDEAMIRVVAESTCQLVLMHARAIPADPNDTLPETDDPVAAVDAFFRSQQARLAEYGVAPERLVYDPGIGFGKSAVQSLALLARLDELAPLPLLIGHSRKSFLSLFTDKPAAARDELTLAVSGLLAQRHIPWLRVHNVVRHRLLLNRLE